MAHEPCERIAIAEVELKNLCKRIGNVEIESSATEKLVTEHRIHIDQQQKWTEDHARLHRDWNMKLWFILIAAVAGVVVPIIVKLA